jgi:hypothetical protein
LRKKKKRLENIKKQMNPSGTHCNVDTENEDMTEESQPLRNLI